MDFILSRRIECGISHYPLPQEKSQAKIHFFPKFIKAVVELGNATRNLRDCQGGPPLASLIVNAHRFPIVCACRHSSAHVSIRRSSRNHKAGFWCQRAETSGRLRPTLFRSENGASPSHGTLPSPPATPRGKSNPPASSALQRLAIAPDRPAISEFRQRPERRPEAIRNGQQRPVPIPHRPARRMNKRSPSI